MVKLVGVKYVDYVSKRTGKKVQGYNLYFTESDVKGVVGLKVFESYVNVETYDSFFVNVSIDSPVILFYNQYGNITSCQIDKN